MQQVGVDSTDVIERIEQWQRVSVALFYRLGRLCRLVGMASHEPRRMRVVMDTSSPQRTIFLVLASDHRDAEDRARVKESVLGLQIDHSGRVVQEFIPPTLRGDSAADTEVGGRWLAYDPQALDDPDIIADLMLTFVERAHPGHWPDHQAASKSEGG